MKRLFVDLSFLLSDHLKKLSGTGPREFDHMPREEFLQIPYGIDIPKVE